MLKNLTSRMKFFESENGYDVKVLPSDVDNNFKTVANRVDEAVGKEIVDDVIAGNTKRDKNSILTTDATQTEILNIGIKPKGIALLKIRGIAIQNDYATEWGFDREILAVVNDSGDITIDNDNNTDLTKDDADWKFDIVANNDSANPNISLKVTGKDSTNILWLANVETNLTYWK
jgi:hypothetical protein